MITAAEVTLTYIDVGPLFLPALLIMMAAKFLIVVSFFMHLKFDNKLFSFLFYMGLGLAVFVYAVALATFHFFGSRLQPRSRASGLGRTSLSAS